MSKLPRFLSRTAAHSELAPNRETDNEATFAETELTRSNPNERRVHRSILLNTKPKTSSRFAGTIRHQLKMRKFPMIQSNKIHLGPGVTKPVGKLGVGKSQISHLAKPTRTFETISDRKRIQTHNFRVSISKQIQLLDFLNVEHRNVSDVKSLGIQKRDVSRFIKNGLVRTTWEDSGVGTFLEITERGKRELQRLKIATASVKDNFKNQKSLIRLKYTTAL